MTACHMAAEVGAVDVVTSLVQAGADCTVMASTAAITPLIVAAAAGEEEMTSLLLAITTDVDAIHADKSAMSALMAAASNGSWQSSSRSSTRAVRSTCATRTVSPP